MLSCDLYGPTSFSGEFPQKGRGVNLYEGLAWNREGSRENKIYIRIKD